MGGDKMAPDARRSFRAKRTEPPHLLSFCASVFRCLCRAYAMLVFASVISDGPMSQWSALVLEWEPGHQAPSVTHQIMEGGV